MGDVTWASCPLRSSPETFVPHIMCMIAAADGDDLASLRLQLQTSAAGAAQ